MEHLTPWVSPAVVVAVLLFVWRRLDTRIDRLDGRLDRVDTRVDGLRTELHAEANGLRTEIREMDARLSAELRKVTERLARLEGAAFGPWPGRPEPETAPEAESDG